ncbi:MAG: hypothetical protein V4516_16000, partial [Pseudomonadota bacterium]
WHSANCEECVMTNEFKLESYGPDEGPTYPKGYKGYGTTSFFRALQTKELYACTKGIFAPVRTTYNASAESQLRANASAA